MHEDQAYQQPPREEQKQRPSVKAQDQLRKSLLKTPSPAKAVPRISSVSDLRELAMLTMTPKLSEQQRQQLSAAIDTYLSSDQLSFSQYLAWTVF